MNKIFPLTLSLLFLLFCREIPGNDNFYSFEVLNGERFLDFCRRIENGGLTDCSTFSKISELENFDKYVFVPGKSSPHRFEGLFRPGNYSIPVSQDDYNCRGSASSETHHCQETKYRFAKNIVVHLLDSSTSRFYGNSSADYYREITLASIIEKEAASNKNYDLVSSVFHNRLNKNMPLGSCPTVEFALGFHRPFLLNKDVAIQSPYNVYRRKGLPPSPIAFFSDEALIASRNPAKTDYIFFVFDWTTGDLHFSEKYEQHQLFAKQARNNFINKFGNDSLHRIYPDKFYEM